MSIRNQPADSPTRRLFVALVPPRKVIAELTAGLAPHRLRWPGLRWTDSSTWHLTCSFMAAVAHPKLPELVSRLTTVAACSGRFTLTLAGAGAFPRVELASVLWLGVQEPGGELSRLAQDCREVARQIGIQTASKPFVGHLTLARCPAPINSQPLLSALAGLQITAWPATELVLFESVLGQGHGGGPRHRALARFELPGR